MTIAIRSLVHSVVPAALAALTVGVAAVGTPVTAVTLTAEALIVGGTGIPNPADVSDYMGNAVDYYIRPTAPSCASVCTPQPVPYIAQWWPFPMEGWGGLKGTKFNPSVASGVTQLTSDLVGLDNPSVANPVVVAGFSQGTTVASQVKADLSKLPDASQANIAFNLLANLTRPNGGLLERFPFLGTVPVWDVTFGNPTVTNTKMATTDISFQYDGVSDFPRYPINALAVLNALAGFVYIHPTLMSPNGRRPGLPDGYTAEQLAVAMANPAYRQQFGDTTYITLPTASLPLLQPIRDIGKLTHTQFLTTPLTDLVEPALRVIIETGYDRTTPYGKPAPMRLIPPIKPVAFTVDLAKAVGQGVKDALSDFGKPGPAQSVRKPALPVAKRTATPGLTTASATAVKRQLSQPRSR